MHWSQRGVLELENGRVRTLDQGWGHPELESSVDQVVGSRLRHQGEETGSLVESLLEVGMEGSEGGDHFEETEETGPLDRQEEGSFQDRVEGHREHQTVVAAFLLVISTDTQKPEMDFYLPGKPGSGGGNPAAACWSMGFV